MTASMSANGGIPVRHNLPVETDSFIGRERELVEVTRLLIQARLLTLTGAGGCGKTCLALRVASGLAGDFPDGICFVPLASLSDSRLVPRAVATSLGVRGIAGRPLLTALTAALASQRLLLVLDNCEHLIGACARLAETLLRACPSLRILATSREPLRIPGEALWRVPSLALPAIAPLPSLESLAQVESVALFLERARARQPDFALTLRNAPSVVAICYQLEGLPLAIELAAAQVWALSLDQIATRLDDALRLLGGGSRTLPRHETLRATLDWSHTLLSSAEAALFQRLAVFGESFDVRAVEGVCGDKGVERANVLPLLIALIEKSLVETSKDANGEARYRLLEPVRQYALARLAAQGEEGRVRRCHACYFLELAEAAEPELMSARRGACIERLALDQGNLRLALDWSLHSGEEGDAEIALRLTGALFWYWVFRGDVSEGLDWAEAALAKGQDAAPTLRAKALHAAGELSWLQGQQTVARTRLETSAALYRTIGDKRGLAYTLQALPMVIEAPSAVAVAEESLLLFEEVGDAWGAAHSAMTLSFLALIHGADTLAARTRMDEALARWRMLDDEWGIAQVLNFLGDLARIQRNVAEATTRYEESLLLLRRQGLTGTVPSVLHNLGYLALCDGNLQRALRLFQESLTLFRGQGDQRGVAECLAGMAGTLGALLQPEQAAQLFGAAEALFETAGATVWLANAADHARSLAHVREQMDAEAFDEAWAEGRAWPLERAIACALEAAPSDATCGAGGDMDRLELTQRERAVAALVAQGLTNRQIGVALVITEGTARLHVKHILRKLGFTSRAQIAGWVVARGLVATPEAQ